MDNLKPNILTDGLTIVRVKANLDEEEDTNTLRGWLDKWRETVVSCTKTGGVWEERYELTLPKQALYELPEKFINAVATPITL